MYLNHAGLLLKITSSTDLPNSLSAFFRGDARVVLNSCRSSLSKSPLPSGEYHNFSLLSQTGTSEYSPNTKSCSAYPNPNIMVVVLLKLLSNTLGSYLIPQYLLVRGGLFGSYLRVAGFSVTVRNCRSLFSTDLR